MKSLKSPALAATLTLALLSGCKSSSLTTAAPAAPVGSVASSTTTTTSSGQTSASFNVTRCLDQLSGGYSARGFMIPDQVTFDPTKAAGFPNGRRYIDPVIDIELAYLFLDLTRHTPTTLVNVPLNPNRLDQPLKTTFPFLPDPFPGGPRFVNTGTNFNFRTNPNSDYVLIERVAVPAVSTINILSARKIAYNEGLPVNDANREFEADITAGLENLTALIYDDLQRLGLTPCAVPR
jgi:Domain of unknown function (DUF4331)